MLRIEVGLLMRVKGLTCRGLSLLCEVLRLEGEAVGENVDNQLRLKSD